MKTLYYVNVIEPKWSDYIEFYNAKVLPVTLSRIRNRETQYSVVIL